ncbi:MAG: carbohydrate porin [Cyanobacteriota bacterium]
MPFTQLTYTQSFPGDKILLTVGQYPIFNFDGNQYLFNQQINFNSYIFSQNGSATYPNAGLGAYGQVNLSDTIQLAAGLQNASDISGATLTTRDFGKGGYAWFAYGQWTPQFKGLGSAQYSFLYYGVPTVSTQSASHGWSINAVQNLNGTWALFGRANQAYDYITPIRSSVGLGAAMNNPLHRSPTDQIGLAVGYSSASPSPTHPPGARNEKVLEAYWSWTFAGGLLLTPSVQYVLSPALAPNRDSAWALSLRATLML